MEKGLAIIEVNEAETRSIFIDKDALECARLNARTKKRLAHAEAVRCKAEHDNRKKERAEARRKAYNLNTVKHLLIYGGMIGAVTWAGTAGMIHPAICIPVSLICLSGACLRLGAWFGRSCKANVHHN